MEGLQCCDNGSDDLSAGEYDYGILRILEKETRWLLSPAGNVEKKSAARRKNVRIADMPFRPAESGPWQY